MLKYITRRTVAAIITLLIVLTVAFCVLRLMPNSLYDDPNLTPETVEMLRSRAHLDRPLIVQFAYYLRGVFLHLDFGTSVKIEPGVPVFDILAGKIPVSLELNFISLALALPLGFVLGTVAALRKNRVTDHLISSGVVLLVSVPSFVVAALLQYGLAFKLDAFPLIFDPSASGFERAMSMVLPLIALTLMPLATTTRYLRGELVEVMSSEYILHARARGQSRLRAVWRHGLRNAAIPMISVIMPMFAYILGGSLVIEQVFAIPGVGGLMVKSINAGDHELTVAAIVFYAAVSIVAVLIADILYGIFDPRIKLSGVKK